MKTPQHFVPTLPEIRALEAVARLGSVSAAAAELNVSQPTISYHIKRLESRWDAKLFRKKGRKLESTELVHDTYNQISAITSSIDNLSFYLSQRSNVKPLSIGVATSFASIFLIKKLEKFSRRHPDVAIKLNASNRYTDFSKEGIDVTLRLLPKLEADSAITMSNPLIPLPNERMRVVCSPAYLEKQLANKSSTQPLDPIMLLQMQLIHEEDTFHWHKYHSAYIENFQGALTQQLSFNNADLILNSAIAGRGVAILRDLYIDDAIAEGFLVEPFQASLACERIFQFVFSDNKMPTKHVWDFISWLGKEMTSMAKSDG